MGPTSAHDTGSDEDGRRQGALERWREQDTGDGSGQSWSQHMGHSRHRVGVLLDNFRRLKVGQEDEGATSEQQVKREEVQGGVTDMGPDADYKAGADRRQSSDGSVSTAAAAAAPPPPPPRSARRRTAAPPLPAPPHFNFSPASAVAPEPLTPHDFDQARGHLDRGLTADANAAAVSSTSPKTTILLPPFPDEPAVAEPSP